MNKVKVLNNSLTVTSALTKTDLEYLQKYAPKTLVLVEEEKDGTINETFRVAFGKTESINEFGICFANVTEKGYVTITALMPNDITDKKDYVLDQFGAIFANLELVEKQALKALPGIKKNRETMKENIEIIEA